PRGPPPLPCTPGRSPPSPGTFRANGPFGPFSRADANWPVRSKSSVRPISRLAQGGRRHDEKSVGSRSGARRGGGRGGHGNDRETAGEALARGRLGGTSRPRQVPRDRDRLRRLPHAEGDGAEGAGRGPLAAPLGSSRGNRAARSAEAHGPVDRQRGLGPDGVVRAVGRQLHVQSDARREHGYRELVGGHLREGHQDRTPHGSFPAALPPMPSGAFRNLTEEGLGSVYAYLRKIPAATPAA